MYTLVNKYDFDCDLDFDFDFDFAELQKLRQQVVAEIRSNQQLERDLDQMDIKIGLLIKNRITLQVFIYSVIYI
jgi:hypothetical protein